jgi:hypothetical protein
MNIEKRDTVSPIMNDAPRRRIAPLFRRALVTACDAECPAVQKAIDAISVESYDGRRGLLAWLETCSDADLCDAVLVRWGSHSAALKLATGQSRDGWCDVFRRVGVAAAAAA